MRTKFPTYKVEVVAPEELEEDPVATTLVVCAGLLVELGSALGDEARREQAVRQGGGELGCCSRLRASGCAFPCTRRPGGLAGGEVVSSRRRASDSPPL